jgi:hypothetical protein
MLIHGTRLKNIGGCYPRRAAASNLNLLWKQSCVYTNTKKALEQGYLEVLNQACLHEEQDLT